jgi:hypothetical protein
MTTLAAHPQGQPCIQAGRKYCNYLVLIFILSVPNFCFCEYLIHNIFGTYIQLTNKYINIDWSMPKIYSEW